MKIFKIVFIVLFSITLASVSFADCGLKPACSGEEDPITGEILDQPGVNCCDDVTVPFDGGVSLLLAAGLGIGVRSAYKKKKQKIN